MCQLPRVAAALLSIALLALTLLLRLRTTRACQLMPPAARPSGGQAVQARAGVVVILAGAEVPALPDGIQVDGEPFCL